MMSFSKFKSIQTSFIKRKVSKLTAISSLLFLASCACDCKVTDSQKTIVYQCNKNQSLTVIYKNRGNRIDDGEANLSFDNLSLDAFLSVKGFGKNYISSNVDSHQTLLQNENVRSVHWQRTDPTGVLTITTQAKSYTFNCSQ